MTRKELKAHCIRQIKQREKWAKSKGEEPSGKVYEEHKLILELLEQEPVLDKIRVEIEGMHRVILKGTLKDDWAVKWNDCLDEVLQIIDKYDAKVRDKE